MMQCVSGSSRGILALIVAIGGATCATDWADEVADIQRGRYIVQIGGCNDCHTPDYAQTDGKVDEKLWLTGSALGWRGPWGTTYPPNLRLAVQKVTEAQWLKHA